MHYNCIGNNYWLDSSSEVDGTVSVDSNSVPNQGLDNKIWGTESSIETKRQHTRTEFIRFVEQNKQELRGNMVI